MKENMLDQIDARDIIPIFTGYQECCKNHTFGPSVRDYYLIHFCLRGCGELRDKYGCHKISAGEVFIIRPGEMTTYSADSYDPWVYSWIAFYGDMADVFNTERSVYPFPMEIGNEISRITLDGITSPLLSISLIYKLIYQLFGERREVSNVAEKVRQYIDFNYMNSLSVNDLSIYFGYERSYLFRIFKAAYGVGIKEYITEKKMESAAALLERGYSVQRTAFAVGYNDQFNFSKAFKKHYGISPRSKKP